MIRKLVSPLLLMALAYAPVRAAVIPNHDFGSIPANGAAGTYTFSLTISSVTAAPVFSLTGTAYSLGTTACTVASGTASCSVPVSFSPTYPGLQLGALYAKNATGSLLATYFLRGVGTSSQMVFSPGVISTLAGNGVWGYANGPLANASFANPEGMALDQAGNLYVADSINQVVRKIAGGMVSTVAGNGSSGYTGDSGAATSAKLNNPTGIAFDAANNLYIADQGNNVIRRVDVVSGVITTVAGGGTVLVTATSSNVPALSALLYGPQSVALDAAGNLFLSSSYYQMVMRVDASTGYMTLYAGNGTGGGSDGLGDGSSAVTAGILNNPTGLAVDASGNLYIADTGHNMIRMVNASTGVISVVAGNGNYGYTGDLGPAVRASLESPSGVRVDAAGNVYIADTGNNVIRQTLAATGTIMTLVGTGNYGYTGDGAKATGATMANASDLVVTGSGQVYISDSGNNVLRQVSTVEPALSFGSVVVGAASSSQPVIVVNRGNQPLTISAGSFGSGFKQVAGLDDCTSSSVLPAGGTCSANMAFAPTAAVAYSSNLSITSNSLNVVGAQSVGLSGTGIAGNAAKVTLSASSLSFGPVIVLQNRSQTISLTNSGSAALTIGGLTLTGTGISAFNMTTSCGGSLAAGSACATTVTFSPAAIGSYSASLAVSDSTGDSPQSIALTGLGSSGSPAGLVQQWNNNGVLWLLSYAAGGGTIAPINWTNTGQGYNSIPAGTPGLIPLDVNGDGQMDVVQQWNNQGVLWLLPYIFNGTTYSFTNWVNTGQGYGSAGGAPHLIPMDINGDGKTDLVQQWNNQGVLWLLPYISNGITYMYSNWINTGQGYSSNPDGTPGFIVMDINGDGKMDLVQQWNNNGVLFLLPYISNGTSLQATNWINTGQGYSSIPGGTPGLIALDINGDGKTDLVQQWSNQGELFLLPYISNGSTLVSTNWINTGQGYSSAKDGTPGFIPMDINGDGKTDLVQQWNNNGVLFLLPYLSNGATFNVTNWINTGQGYSSTPSGTPSLVAMDLNGDGKTDLFQQWNNNGTFFILPYISNGSTLTSTNWINTGQGFSSTPAGTPGLLGGSYPAYKF